MKFTINWLKKHLDTNASNDVIIETLTAIGLEVEEVIDMQAIFAPFKVAEIVATEAHPDADKLKVCKVNTGEGELQIVCGAENARAGIKVVLANVGVHIPNENFTIKKSKIRGVESCGMMCSEKELGLGDNHAGIMELPNEAEIGQSFANIVGKDDTMIEVAITPNKADCLGVRGIARDLAAADMGTLKPLTYNKIEGAFASPISVNIPSPQPSPPRGEGVNGCPLFVGRYFKGVKNTNSPDWLKQKLEAVGITPISALVDITNYMTLDLNRPMHVFDAEKIQGNISIRPSKKGEELAALDDKTYKLDDGMVGIYDDSGIISLGGIIGGESTGCSLETTDVFIEIALFDPTTIAKTARKLKIETDAKHRFERSVDPAFVMEALDIASSLIVELCGGEVSEPVIAGEEPSWQKEVLFNPEKIESLSGVKVDLSVAGNILEKLGFTVENGDVWKITPPSWRADIDGEADIVEEIIRIIGYDEIPTLSLPHISHNPTDATIERNRKIKRLLASHGLKETRTWSFIQSDFAKKFGGDNPALILANPISSDMNYMRPSLVPSLLLAVQKNFARGFENLAFFEMGNQFSNPNPDGHMMAVSGIRAGKNADKNIYGDSRKVDIFDAKADILEILNFVGLGNAQIDATAPSWYHPARCGTFKLGKNILGYFGEIHPAILKGLKIKETVVGFELFLDNLPKPKPRKNKPLQMNDLQKVERDFAFIVDADTPADEIIRAANKADKKLISGVRIFDIYEGENLGENKKSIAISVSLQPIDKTLTDDEIQAISDKIVSSVQKSVGGELRDS